jgi:cytidine deaminase
MAARKKAYAPYSNYLVGVAIVDSKGGVHSGCNVENASYGASLCAERVAIGKMVSRGSKKIDLVVVVASSDTPVFPCGMCLQVIQEFGHKARVLAINSRGTLFEATTMEALFPSAFSPEKLKG